MAVNFLHGIELIEVNDGPRSVPTVKSSVIMAFGTAPAANQDDFPLNEPVLLLSQPRKAATLGTYGTLKAAVDGIYDQDAAAVIICRVEEAKTVTQAPNQGNSGNGTLTLADPAYADGSIEGEYSVICTASALNGGVFKVVDPDGNNIGTATVGQLFDGHIRFTISDGDQDFVEGDGFTVTVEPDLYGTWSNILGDVTTRTGVWAALAAKGMFGFAPKLLCVPGFTGQRVEGAVTNLSLQTAGSGYTSAPNVHIYPDDATINVTRTADEGNEGDGTMTLGTPAYGNNVVAGEYRVIITEEDTDGGSFKVLDPDGAQIGTGSVGAAFDGPIKFTIADGSSDFKEGDAWTVAVEITGGHGTAAEAEAEVSAGAVTALEVKRAGFNYEAARVAFSGGSTGAVSHATATATVGEVGNPVVAELQAIADRLRGIVIADGPNSTDEDAVTYRGDWGSPRVYIVDPHVMVFDTELDTPIAQPASARVCGLISRMDRTHGFWWSPSNQILNGVIGTSRPVDFNVSDPNSQANFLNENEIATIIRHEGFRLWGNRTAASDQMWAFLAVRRTADMVYESIEQAFMWALDRPLTSNNILEVAESVNEYLRHLIAEGAIIGGRAWLEEELNTPAELQAGKLHISFDLEPPAPLEHLVFHAHRNGEYYTEVIERVVRELAA